MKYRVIAVIRKRALIAIVSSLLRALSLLCLPCSVCFGQTWSTLPVDVLVSMNTSTPGTPLSSSIITAGTVTSNTSFSWSNPSGAFTVGANQNACSNLGPVAMQGTGGTTYPAQSLNYNSVGYNDAYSFNNEKMTMSGTAANATQISALVCITIGPPAQPSSGSDFDRFLFWNNAGYYAVIQFNNGNGCKPSKGYIGARIEVKPTAHSSCIYVLPQQSYWFTLYWNINTGLTYLHAYTAQGTPLPCDTTIPGCTTLSGDAIANQTATVTAGDKGGGGFHQVYIGNNENGIYSGTTSHFQNVMVNWTTAPFPLFWNDQNPTSYQLTTAASPSNGGTVSPTSGSDYPSGTVVNLLATANPGYAFTNWTGPVANTSSASTTVTMNAPESVTANFQTTVPVTVGSSPAGLSFTVDGTTYTHTQTLTWTIGTNHTLATTSPQTPDAATQYTFASWSDSGGISHSVTAPSTATTYTASFNTSYQLTTAASPSNGGTVSPVSGSYYPSGTVVSLLATANPGYAFTSWTGLVANTSSASTTVTMNAPQSVTANFQTTVPVTVGSSPPGLSFTVDGTTYTSTQTLTWTTGTNHTLATTSPQTPVAGTQYTFASWSDAGAISHSVTAPSSATTYTASFTTSYQLTTAASPSNGGTVSPVSGSYYPSGTVVNLLATANSGYAFTNWTGPVANTSSASTTVTMNAPESVTANFQSTMPMTVPVTVGTSPAGLSFTVDGTAYTSTQTLTWTIGTSHTLATTTPQTPVAGTQYTFTSWSDAGAISHSVTAPSTATTYTASFSTSNLWSTLPVDLVVSMNTSSSGTPLTSSIMNAGTVSYECTVGTTCTWGTPAGSAFTVGANQSSLSNLGPVVMNGTGGVTYPANSLNYNSIVHADGDPGTSDLMTFSGTPAAATAVSALVGITLGPPYQPSSGSNWDLLIFYNTAGYYAVMQFNSHCSATVTYGVRIEVKPTAHSPCIALTPQQSYYFSLDWNINTGVANLYAYTTAGTLIGNVTVTAGDKGGGGLHQIKFGNADTGVNSGTFTYFQNIMFNWTTAPSPLFWTK